MVNGKWKMKKYQIPFSDMITENNNSPFKALKERENHFLAWG